MAMINMKRTYIFALTLSIAISAFSITLNDAKALYNNGEYEKALQAFKELLAKNSKSAKDANLNNYAGLCLYNLGEYDQSIPYFTIAESKSIPDASKHLAMIAFNNYEFEDALDYMSKNSVTGIVFDVGGNVSFFLFIVFLLCFLIACRR